MTMQRVEQVPGSSNVPWFYKNEPCDVVAVGVDDGKVCALFVKVKERSDEIVCYADVNGIFQDVKYASH